MPVMRTLSFVRSDVLRRSSRRPSNSIGRISGVPIDLASKGLSIEVVVKSSAESEPRRPPRIAQMANEIDGRFKVDSNIDDEWVVGDFHPT